MKNKLFITTLVVGAALFLSGCDTTYSEDYLNDYANDYAADVLSECQDEWESYAASVQSSIESANSELSSAEYEDFDTLNEANSDAQSYLSSALSESEPDCSDL